MGTYGGTNVPEKYDAYVQTSAARWNISPSILAAQLNQESGFNPNSVSSAGAVGIAQFLPSTAAQYGIDPYNVQQSIDGMAMLDAKYRDQFGSIDEALAAYNAGPGAVEKYNGIPPYAETQQYVQNILAAANEQGNPTGTDPADASGSTDTTTVGYISATGSLLDHVLSTSFWERIGVGALGVFVVIAGILWLTHKPLNIQSVMRVAK